MAVSDSLKSFKIILLLLIGALFFIWSIPHTISIRYALLIFILFISTFLAYRKGFEFKNYKLLLIPIIIFLVFLAWTFFVAIFLSDYRVESLGEIKSNLITNIFICLAAAFTAIASEDDSVLNARNISLLFFTACMVHLVYVDFQGLYVLFTKGYFPTRVASVRGFTSGHLQIAYLSVYALMFIFAEGSVRMIERERFLRVSTPVLVICYLLVLFSLCLAGARNAVVMSTILLVIVIAIYLYQNKPDLKKVAVLVFACLSFFILWYYHVKFTPEWKSVLSIMSTALDTKENKCWIDCKEFPIKNKQGQVVSAIKDKRGHNRTFVSNYYHLAWFKEGLLFVWDKPLGRGFDENAFGLAVSRKYNVDARGSFSHSGVIDLAIGTGIPGLLLFFIFLLSISVISFKAFKRARGYNAILLFLIVANVGVRMLVDSILRDHMMQQNFFLFGLLSIFMIKELRNNALVKSNAQPHQVE